MLMPYNIPANLKRLRLETGGAVAFWSLLLAAILVFHLGLFLIGKIAAYGMVVQATSYLQLAVIRISLVLFFEVSLSILLLNLIGIERLKIFRMVFGSEGLGRMVLAGAIAGIVLFGAREFFYRVNGFGMAGITDVSMFYKYPEFSVFLSRILKHLTTPFGEELFFRGFLFTMFSMRFSGVKALIMSSLIFSASHLNPGKLFSGEVLMAHIWVFINGGVYCFLFRKYKNLFPSIAAHVLFNLLTSLFYLG